MLSCMFVCHVYTDAVELEKLWMANRMLLIPSDTTLDTSAFKRSQHPMTDIAGDAIQGVE